jgi:hypothetical protein
MSKGYPVSNPAIPSASPLILSPALRAFAGVSVSSAGNTPWENITDASVQWSMRKPEERFWNYNDAISAVESYRNRLTLRDASPDEFAIVERNNVPVMRNMRRNSEAMLSPLAIDQLCRLTKSPANYIRTLPGKIAAECLAHGWEHNRGSDAIRLQVLDSTFDDKRTIRAITSPSHDFLANSLLLQAFARLVDDGKGWKIPPARCPEGYTGERRKATLADVLTHAGTGLSPKVGDEICASGLYASDRDCFAIIVDDSQTMQEEGGMYRFMMGGNSEVACGPLEFTTGRMRGICGNHILWDVADVINIKAIHKGDNASRNLSRMQSEVSRKAWRDDRKEFAAAIAAARACQLAKNKEELISLLFGRKILSKREAEIAWDVNADLSAIDGPTGSAWGIVNAVTRMSQYSRFMADRNDMDGSAAKIMAMAAN